jgi:hypothetical protein
VDGSLVQPLPELPGGVRGPAVGPGEDGRGRAPLPINAEDAVPERAQSHPDYASRPLPGATERLVDCREDQPAELVGI